MIFDRKYDSKGELISERTFNTVSDASAFYKRLKDPDVEEHPNGCWNCLNFDYVHEACTINWNNLDESYYNPETDDRDPTDCCDDHCIDLGADPSYWFEYGGNEP